MQESYHKGLAMGFGFGLAFIFVNSACSLITLYFGKKHTPDKEKYSCTLHLCQCTT